VRRDQLGETAGRDHGRIVAELGADAVDERVYLAREAVDDPGLQRRARVLADHRRRRDEVHLEEACRAREERVHRDLHAGSEHAPRVLAGGGDDVEVRRGPEVDDDAGRAVELLGGDGVGDPVRADLARVVVQHRHPGARPRADHVQRGVRPPLRDLFVRAEQRRHDAREADTVHRLRVEEPGERQPQLVAGSPRLGGDAPVVDQPFLLEEAEAGLRVADVDREQHRGILAEASPERGIDGGPPHETIVTSMSALSAELPLSPELVLVSPPEVASLARLLLDDPEPATGLIAAATRARSSRIGVTAFSALCLANCVAPFALAIVAAS
jgi:hypothetical protein